MSGQPPATMTSGLPSPFTSATAIALLQGPPASKVTVVINWADRAQRQGIRTKTPTANMAIRRLDFLGTAMARDIWKTPFESRIRIFTRKFGEISASQERDGTEWHSMGALSRDVQRFLKIWRVDPDGLNSRGRTPTKNPAQAQAWTGQLRKFKRSQPAGTPVPRTYCR